jgi:hypothetical protein
LDKNWSNALGICNLLQNCQLIPEKIRETYLWKGINEEKLYYVLSACVGYQSLQLSTQVQTKLKEITKKDSSFIAPRAFTSISDNLKFPEELSFVASLMSHPHSTGY